ncbi:MAG TPA: hypothetical protein VG326_05095 [Tepidisphaeraceae bacterium]|nr:hypothetical protein [Tepidisphaeraceae bacterium]
MEQPIELLKSILAQSQPHETIRLPLHQALSIATLDERELGPLSDAIERYGVVRALEDEGLFARQVVICQGQQATFAVVDARRIKNPRMSFTSYERSHLPAC